MALLSNHSLFLFMVGALTHPYIPLHFEEMIFLLISTIFRRAGKKRLLGDCAHLRRLWRCLVKNQCVDLFQHGDSGFTEEEEKDDANREIAYERIFTLSIGGAYDTFRHMDN